MEDGIDKILSKIKELSVRYKYVILCIVAISIGVYVIDYIQEENKPPIDISQYCSINQAEEVEGKEINIIVHIEGAVNNPGVYQLPIESRLNDVINISGGLTKDAITTNINLARKLNDGEKIYVYRIGEEEIIPTSTEDTSHQNGKININNATKEQLTTLPGIGNATATKILEYIKENGKFKKIEDIKNVGGIGDSKFEKIKELIDIK